MKLTGRVTLFVTALMLTFSIGGLAQKGVDTQTQKIKDEGNKVTTRTNDVNRTFSWGKDKTKTRGLLPNPYKFNGRRDVIVGMIADVLREKKIVVDEASSRLKEGIIVTQPFVFAKGSVITQSELSRYAIMDTPETAWSRAQYTLTIEVQSIDGASNNVSVNAKVEGRGGNGLMAEWLTLRSSGFAEDEFLAQLVETVTGQAPERVVDNTNN
jgi:hypothetical protein